VEVEVSSILALKRRLGLGNADWAISGNPYQIRLDLVSVNRLYFLNASYHPGPAALVKQ
jgi:hypothetical protein